MKLKRLLSGVLAAVVALSTMALTPFTTAFAADVVDTGTCHSSGNASKLTWTLDSNGVLTISGTGDMNDTSDSGSATEWKYYNHLNDIKEVVFEEGITSVGASAFQNYTNLTKVTLPSTFKTINKSAFRASSITSIEIPSAVSMINTSAFYDCKSLNSITIPDFCKLGGSVFKNCSSLETVSIGRDVSYTSSEEYSALGKSQFLGCTSLKDVYIYGKNVTYAPGAYASNSTFDNGSQIYHIYKDSTTESTLKAAGYLTDANVVFLEDKEVVEVKDLLNAIDAAKTYNSAEYTEESYKALTDAVTKGNEVVANEDATQDEVDAAANAINDAIKNLVELTVVTGSAGENVTWSLDKTTGILTISGTGAMYKGKNMGAAYWTYSKYADKIKEVVIEEGVTSVGSCAFGPANYMDSTTAFPNLTKITMPSTIEKIEVGAFLRSNIENLTVPEKVTDIGAFAYQGTKIENVKLNEGMGLGGYAFKDCNSLKEVTIPAGITYRRDAVWTGDNGTHYQFENCTALEKVTILGGGTVIQSYSTNENGLADGMFSGCSALKEVIIKCENLAYVKCANSATSLSGETFETIGTNITYNVIKGSTTETTLRDAGYITDENVVYSYDITELNAKIAEAEAIDLELYTEESYAVLTAAIGAAKTVKSNVDATQADVDEAIKVIDDAIKALTVKGIDEIKASLEAFTQNIEKLLTVKNESDYTTESWTALKDAFTAAKEALGAEEPLIYKEYNKLLNDLSGAYTGLKTASTSKSKYVGTIYGGYEVTYNQETDSYKIVVSDDVDMKSVVGTTYVKITFTPNTADLQYELAYGTLNIWNFLDNLAKYGQYAGGSAFSGTDDTVVKYDLSIPDETSAFSLTAGTGWTKDKEVFYVKSVEFYNANDELLYTYSADSIGEGDVRNLKTAIENAEALDKSKYTEESLALLELVLEEANATLNDTSATKDDYRVRASELDAAVKALAVLIDYTALDKAIADGEAVDITKYTDESVKTLTDAITAGKAVKENAEATQDDVDNAVKAINDAIAALETKPVTGAVSGKIVVSDGNAETEMTVTATAADGTETSVTATSMGTYTIENLALGEYTLTISGGKYVERTYEITVTEGSIDKEVNLNPLGDINGDGKVTTADVGMANSHAKGVKILEGYAFDCANVKNTDAEVTTADVGMINSHAKGVKTLW